nr:response regulator [Bacteroidota bacterium]
PKGGGFNFIIKGGDFTVRNTIPTEDELGSLATAFNSMADVIESRINIQQGISDISDTMIAQTTMQEFGAELLKRLMKITGANMSTFYILNDSTSEYEHFASVGANREMLKPFNTENPEGEFGNALSTKGIFYLQNIPENTVFKFQTVAGDAIPKEIITIPLLVGNTVVALISLVNIQKFSNECYEILKQSWAGINTTYSNLMANERTRILADYLSKTNQQLEVQSKELQEQAEELQSQAEELQSTTDELQEQNLELEAQRSQVETANRLKSEFLSNMSHELRTPLNSIMALSRVLIMQAKAKLSDEEYNWLEIVERNGKRLLSLINDILDLSKIEAGKMEIIPEQVSIGSLVRLIKENLQTLAEKKDLQLNLSIPDNLPKVETDESRLHQVLSNIIGNAIKFTDGGSVDISVTHQSENIVVEVRDTGIGISEKMLPHIFEEFRQADGTSSRKYEGTGLGLAIAKKMIYVLGGNIKVESQLGKGTVFTITIPTKWYEYPVPADALNVNSAWMQTTDNTILVVDDDPGTAEDISGFLNGNGYKTMIATSGKEALQLAEKYQPFAITLDIIMPEMDGWEVLQELKANPQTKDIPVIVMSVSDDKDTGFALGAIGYINKPVDKHILISQIRKINRIPGSVMIVDDNEIELQQMAEILKAEKINTLLARGGKECIKMIKTNIPDILVLDLMMPDVDGFMVLDNIRKQPETRNLPVIVVTAKDLTKEDKAKLGGKISSVIAKSGSTPQDLFNKIKRIIVELEKSQRSDALLKENPETRILMVEDNEDAIIQVKAVLEKEGYKGDAGAGLRNILVVEDNPDNMVTIKAILKGKYQITEAIDGEHGLNIIRLIKPDLVLLDMSLPKMDGKEIMKILKADHETKNIPVIAVTAQAMKGDKEKFMKAGCDGYISKPIEPELLLKLIVDLLKD